MRDVYILRLTHVVNFHRNFLSGLLVDSDADCCLSTQADDVFDLRTNGLSLLVWRTVVACTHAYLVNFTEFAYCQQARLGGGGRSVGWHSGHSAEGANSATNGDIGTQVPVPVP